MDVNHSASKMRPSNDVSVGDTVGEKVSLSAVWVFVVLAVHVLLLNRGLLCHVCSKFSDFLPLTCQKPEFLW
jgi:hypothetical protein